MKLFNIGGYLYPVPVADAKDGFIELPDDLATLVLEAWARGMPVGADGTLITKASAVEAVKEFWEKQVPEHPYFKAKKALSESVAAGLTLEFRGRFKEAAANWPRP